MEIVSVSSKLAQTVTSECFGEKLDRSQKVAFVGALLNLLR